MAENLVNIHDTAKYIFSNKCRIRFIEKFGFVLYCETHLHAQIIIFIPNIAHSQCDCDNDKLFLFSHDNIEAKCKRNQTPLLMNNLLKYYHTNYIPVKCEHILCTFATFNKYPIISKYVNPVTLFASACDDTQRNMTRDRILS